MGITDDAAGVGLRSSSSEDKFEEVFREGSWVGEAYRVLKSARGALSGPDLYARIVERGLVKLSGQTPKNTLMGALSRQRQDPKSPFVLTPSGEHVLRQFVHVIDDAVSPSIVSCCARSSVLMFGAFFFFIFRRSLLVAVWVGISTTIIIITFSNNHKCTLLRDLLMRLLSNRP